MNNKKYFLLLITLLLIASCGKQEQNEVNLSESGSSEAPIVVEALTGDTITPEVKVTPIPVSTKTASGIQTKFVEPAATKFDSKPVIEPVVPQPKKVETPVVVAPKVIRTEQTYKSPGGDDTMAFTITIQDGKIVNASATTIKAGEISAKFQSGFAGAVGSSLKGLTLQEAKSVGTIAGASLTTGAFKQAIKNM